jgi:hypothetical protein
VETLITVILVYSQPILYKMENVKLQLEIVETYTTAIINTQREIKFSIMVLFGKLPMDLKDKLQKFNLTMHGQSFVIALQDQH